MSLLNCCLNFNSNNKDFTPTLSKVFTKLVYKLNSVILGSNKIVPFQTIKMKSENNNKKIPRWPGIEPGSQERQSYMIPLHYQRFHF